MHIKASPICSTWSTLNKDNTENLFLHYNKDTIQTIMKFATFLQSLASLSVAMTIPTESSQKEMSPLERLLGANGEPVMF